jgi:hypothetical protein
MKNPLRKADPPALRDLPTIGQELGVKLKLGSQNIIEIGTLLIEANKKAEHGEWLPWLKEYFGKSENSARNYMWATGLAVKYANFADLKINPSAIFALKGCPDKVITAIMEAAETTWISADDVISYNLAVLNGAVDSLVEHFAKAEERRAKEAHPEDSDDLEGDPEPDSAQDEEAEADKEAEDQLDGPAPDLPEDTSASEAKGRDQFARDDFKKAIEILNKVITKESQIVVGVCQSSDLENIISFLEIVLQKQKRKKAA